MRHCAASWHEPVGHFAPASRAEAVEAGQIPARGQNRFLFACRRPCPHDYQSGNGARRRVIVYDCLPLDGGKELFMKKTFNLTDLDCANCAAKMECAVAKLEGVKSAEDRKSVV